MNTKLRFACVVFTLVFAMAGVAAAEVVRWVPAAASVDGLYGTRWTTDLWVYNLAIDEPITVYVTMHSSQDGTAVSEEVSIVVPPVNPVELNDAVMELFGADGVGALQLRSEYPFDVRSRTFNDGGEAGSFGQGIPGVAPKDALPFGALIGLANVPGPDGVRSNLGLVNPNGQTAHVLVFLFQYAADGSMQHFDHFQIEVGPGGWYQQDIFRLADLEDETVENAYAIVAADGEVVEPITPVFAYLSRIDNRSGDAVYIEPFFNPRFELNPEQVTLDYSVESTGAFVPFAVTYMGPDGEQMTVLEPAADWSAEVAVDGNQIVCLQAIGHVEGPENGTVSACLGYDDPGGNTVDPVCHQCTDVAGELCTVEVCRFVY